MHKTVRTTIKQKLTALAAQLPWIKLKRRQQRIHKLYIVVASVALLVGLSLSVLIFNYRERNIDRHLEVSFVTPRQAVVFWTSDHRTLGSVQYGTAKNNRKHTATQTSSTPDTIHAVVIDDVPLEGMWLTIHTESDSLFYRPKPVFVTFDPTLIE
jgi:hypothetical protein